MLDPSPPPQADTPATQSSPPDAVWTHWADTLHAAQAQGRPLRIRGGGTKDFYGPPLAQDLPVMLLDQPFVALDQPSIDALMNSMRPWP